MSRMRLPVVLSLLLCAASVSAANKGGGTFRKGTNKLTMKYVCAYRLPARSGQATKVYLTSHPLSCADFDGMFDPDSSISSKMREANGGLVRITINEDGSEAGLYLDMNNPSDSFNVSGSGDFAVTANTDKRIEGSWATKGPQEFFDKTFEFKMNWAADVLAGAVTGTALPAGGGDPGKAYLAYVNAVNKKDHKSLKKMLPQNRAESVYASEGSDYFEDSFKWYRESELVSAKVLSGWVNGETATLKVEGKLGSGDKAGGYVQMKREGGTWKPAENSLSTIYE